MTAVVHTAEVTAWCREYAAKIARGEAERFHAVLADPPYELNFMGGSKKDWWDNTGVAFQPETWRAIASVCHPGAFIFAFGGTRTYHKMATAMEEAGLLPHSLLAWINAAGFPKATRIDTGEWADTGDEETLTDIRANHMHAGRDTSKVYVRPKREPTGEAARWAGHRYGRQAIKPAVEPISVFQVPYVGRPVDCITKTGAGALNIDGARIAGPDGDGHWSGEDGIDYPSKPGYDGGFTRGGRRRVAGQRRNDVYSRTWDDEQSLCASCAVDADERRRLGKAAIQESTATRVVEPTRNESRPDRGDANTMDTGCSSGRCLEAPSDARSGSSCSSTVSCGSENAGQSHTDALSTTSTGEKRTTGSRTCVSCSAPITIITTGGEAATKNRRGGIEASRDGDSAMPAMSASAVRVGRWPSNLTLSHCSPDPLTGDSGCVRVGTRRVRAISGGGGMGKDGVSDGTVVYGAYGPRDLPPNVGKGDADGLETVDEYRCVDGCPIRALNEQSGILKSGELLTHHKRGGGSQIGTFNIRDRTGEPCDFGGDEGGAARFFHNSDWSAEVFERIKSEAPFRYVAKASRSERDAGLDDVPLREGGTMDGGDIVSDGRSAPKTGRVMVLNHHPTCKPLSLTKWLATLLLAPPHVAPRRLLNPFCGSGGEAIGAMLAGFEDVVSIEMSDEYAQIARSRLAFWEKHRHDDVAQTVAAWQRARGEVEAAKASGQMGLFGVNKTDGRGV